jgi:hypothetical protein
MALEIGHRQLTNRVYPERTPISASEATVSQYLCGSRPIPGTQPLTGFFLNTLQPRQELIMLFSHHGHEE